MFQVKKIALFASGSGTNVENIIQYFKKKSRVQIVLVLTNNPKAGVIERAKRLGVPVHIFDKTTLMSTNNISSVLQQFSVNLIVLSGFLLKVPQYLIDDFPEAIINIHPALLPGFGGKGMYGMNVHKAVIESGELKSGITIHLVNEHYDKGRVLFQQAIDIDKEETPDSLAKRIHELEYKYFPQIIESFLFENQQFYDIQDDVF
ncbi:MAG: phosphoribosylglycinamide formyltransferase [Bacteroidales bacterium]|nr:phosphoribosylglycinamide formyltransferase [Bacteroidales bacterium]